MWLYELASKRSKEIQKLNDQTEVVIEHLVKIWLFPKYGSVPDWIEHITKDLHSTDKLKGSHKFLDKSTILENTYEDHEQFVEYYRKHFVKRHDKGEYKGYIRYNYRDLKALKKCIKSYFDKLAQQLSTTGLVDEDEVTDFIVDSGFFDIKGDSRQFSTRLDNSNVY